MSKTRLLLLHRRMRLQYNKVNYVFTGGAQPLHMAGMSRANQASVPRLVEAGADIEVIIINCIIVILILLFTSRLWTPMATRP